MPGGLNRTVQSHLGDEGCYDLVSSGVIQKFAGGPALGVRRRRVEHA